MIRCQKGGQGSVAGISHITWGNVSMAKYLHRVCPRLKSDFSFLEIELLGNK